MLAARLFKQVDQGVWRFLTRVCFVLEVGETAAVERPAGRAQSFSGIGNRQLHSTS
jgi:hypothetical protein